MQHHEQIKDVDCVLHANMTQGATAAADSHMQVCVISNAMDLFEILHPRRGKVRGVDTPL